MKLKFLRFVKISLLILPIVLVAYFSPFTFSSDTERIRGFYLEDKGSLDVVLLGSSDIYAGFSSCQAYEEYGFTSYPYTVASNLIDYYKYQIDEIYRMQNPKLVIVEINGCLYSGAHPKADAILRTYVQGVPLSKNKIQMIHKLGGGNSQKLSYYLPFMMYHGTVKLSEIRNNYFEMISINEAGYSRLKGIFSNTGSSEVEERIDIMDDTSKAELYDVSERYLIQLLEHCKKNDYNILFVRFPRRIESQDQYETFQRANTAGEIIRNYGFDFINFEYFFDDIGFDPECDFYNSEHMNVYGSQKFTRYLCDILVNDYGISGDVQTEGNRQKWDEAVEYKKLYDEYFTKKKLESPNKAVSLTEKTSLMEKLDSMREELSN